MKTKKVLSAVLAAAMSVSALGITAFADDPISASNTLTMIGSLEDVKINATIPTKPAAFINPYKAAISLTGKGDAVNGAVETVDDSTFASGVVSPTYKIVNKDRSFKLGVSVTTSIKAGSGISVSDTYIDKEETEKSVFAYLNTTTIEDSNAKPVFFDTTYVAGSKSQAIFGEDAETTSNIMIIGAAKAGAGTSDPDVPANGYFRVEGDSTAHPDKAWTDKDTVTLTLILDLTPTRGEPKDLSLVSVTCNSKDGVLTDGVYVITGVGTTPAKVETFVKSNLEGSDATTIVVFVKGSDVETITSTKDTSDNTKAKANSSQIKCKDGDELTIIVSDADGNSKSYPVKFVAAP